MYEATPTHSQNTKWLQGHATTTVLTNRSKYITVINDDKSTEANKNKARRESIGKHICSNQTTNSCQNRLKGTRPMHATTLTFEKQPVQSSYITTSKSAFSGRKDIKFSDRPERCQSLHLSQFQIGSNEHSGTAYVEKNDDNFTQVYVPHEDEERWRREMRGTDMMGSLTYDFNRNLGNPAFSEARTLAHNFSAIDAENPYPRPVIRERYDLITGNPTRNSPQRDFRKVSGNRMLRLSREQTKEGILG